MNASQFKAPAFVASAVSCVLLLFLLISVLSSPKAPTSAQVAALDERVIELTEQNAALQEQVNRLSERADELGAPDTSSAQEAESALRTASELIESKDFAPAFDMILVASRLAPSDPRLVDAVATFVSTAQDSSDEATLLLVEELLDRSEALVHLQAPSEVVEARKKLTELQEQYLASLPPLEEPSPFQEVNRLLAASESTGLPISVRSMAVDQARSALDESLLSSALLKETDEGVESDEVVQLRKRIEAAELACVTEHFRQAESKAKSWMAEATKLENDSDSLGSAELPAHFVRISSSIESGYERFQEIVPYSQASVPGAEELSRTVENQLKSLQNRKSWLYNQQILRMIDEAESRQDVTPERKLSRLATVKEELLAPYVHHRYSELWQKSFDSVNEDGKRLAMKQRILKVQELGR